MAKEVILEFAHFGNGVSGNDVLITSDLVLVNVAEVGDSSRRLLLRRGGRSV